MSTFIVILIIAAGTIIVTSLSSAGDKILLIMRYSQSNGVQQNDGLQQNNEVQQNIEITHIEMMDVEERILKLLKDGGGALYQSEIGRQLSLPKSTVSAALNELHARKQIQKIKKGRENLIRLILPRMIRAFLKFFLIHLLLIVRRRRSINISIGHDRSVTGAITRECFPFSPIAIVHTGPFAFKVTSSKRRTS